MRTRALTALMILLAALLTAACGKLLGADFDGLRLGTDAAAPDAATPDASDAAVVDGTVDAASASADADVEDADAGAGSCAPGPASDFYVAHDAAVGPCSFDTITAALAAARASSAASRVVHVAAGTYDRASGETFPLDVRGGVSLVGEGEDTTTIRGLGAVDPSAAGGVPATFDAMRATITTGDERAPSRIARLQLLSGEPVSGRTYGVACDRGNAKPPGIDRPAPTTTVDHVVFGAAYDVALMATNATRPAPTACNVTVTSSTFRTGSWNGVWSAGCTEDPNSPFTSLQIGGDDPSEGNRFEGISARNTPYAGCGAGVKFWGCTSWSKIRNNLFTSGEVGITITHETTNGGVVNLYDNTFEGQSNGGLHLIRAAKVNDLVGNRFTGSAALGTACLGVASTGAVWLFDQGSPASPGIANARDNVFAENRIGVHFDATHAVATSSDFGHANGAGGNAFRCNSHPSAPSADVWIGAATAPGVVLSFAGNTWDHVPPTTSTSASIGLDVFLPPSGASVTLDDPKPPGEACPGGFVP